MDLRNKLPTDLGSKSRVMMEAMIEGNEAWSEIRSDLITWSWWWWWRPRARQHSPQRESFLFLSFLLCFRAKLSRSVSSKRSGQRLMMNEWLKRWQERENGQRIEREIESKRVLVVIKEDGWGMQCTALVGWEQFKRDGHAKPRIKSNRTESNKRERAS